MKTYKTAYACGVDWQHELGETNMELYASVEDLKKDRTCYHECGIVKLRIELDSWIEEQDFTKLVNK